MISIILPTYNEAENIQELIDGLFKNITDNLQVVVIDDNSPDLTWKIAEECHRPNVSVYRRSEERGLASAIAVGIKQSKGDVVGWMDADMSMPPSLLPQMLSCLDEYDIVIGSRYVEGGRDQRTGLRIITSEIINQFCRLFLGLKVRDCDSGFIVARRSVFDRVTINPKGYGDYFIEFIYRASKLGLKIKEVPYVFKDREKGKSKTQVSIAGFIKFGWGYLVKVISLRFSVTD